MIEMWILTYRRVIPRAELLLRVLGPDRFNTARYYVDAVKYGREPEREDGKPVTYASVVVLPPSETRTVIVGGQEWLDPSAVEVDEHGIATLVPVDA